MITEEEFVRKLKKQAKFEHSSYQKEILWGRLQAYIDSPSGGHLWHFSFKFAYLSAVVLIVLLASTGVTFASQDSLPGEPLYPVKRFSEEAVIFVKFKNADKKKARVELTTKRADEFNQLVVENPEKAEEVLNEYENSIRGYMDDPELSETLHFTITVNEEYLFQAAQQAPENMKIRIRSLIEQREGEQESKSGEGKVEGEETKKPGTTKKEGGSSIDINIRTNETSSPQP